MIKEIMCPLTSHNILLINASDEEISEVVNSRFDINSVKEDFAIGGSFQAVDQDGKDWAVLTFKTDALNTGGSFLWAFTIIAHEVNHLTFYLSRFINNGNDAFPIEKEEYFNYHFTMLLEYVLYEMFKDTYIGTKSFSEVVHPRRTKKVPSSNKRKRRKSSK